MRKYIVFLACTFACYAVEEPLVEQIQEYNNDEPISVFMNEDPDIDKDSPIILQNKIQIHEARAKYFQKKADRLIPIDFTSYRSALRDRDREIRIVRKLRKRLEKFPLPSNEKKNI